MKSCLLSTAIAISSIASVFSVPAIRSTLDAISVPAPQGFQMSGATVEPSVDGAPKDSSVLKGDAAAAEYWVCIAVSQSTLRYGWAQGASSSSALNSAKANCGQGDCNAHQCQEQGCVGIDYGNNYVAISRATGSGGNDGSEAANEALATCKANTSGCGTPGYFCSQYVS
jgi:hypothetical protein